MKTKTEVHSSPFLEMAPLWGRCSDTRPQHFNGLAEVAAYVGLSRKEWIGFFNSVEPHGGWENGTARLHADYGVKFYDMQKLIRIRYTERVKEDGLGTFTSP